MWSRFLASRWFVPCAVLLGVLLMAPAINIGFVADDFLHWAMLTGRSPNAQPGSHWGLFTFFDGVVAHNQALKESGRLIWWGSDQLKLSFWRPLSEVSHWLDYQLWPQSVLMMHVHNLLWYGALIYALSRLYRLLDPNPPQAHLATWLFAGNLMHVFAVAWLAARNQLIAGVLLAGALAAFHLWRTGRGARYAWVAGALLAVGLLSAEAAIAIVGYMVAYLLTMEAGKPVWGRVRAILPFVLIVLVWKAVHSHLGYGSVASPAYIDPASNLPRFAQSMVLRLPALMAAQWFGASTGVFEQLPRQTQVLYAAVSVSLLAGLGLVVHYLKGFASPLARFYLLGSIFVLVPACATLTMDRLVLNANIGMSGFLAIVICQVLARRQALVGWPAAAAKWLVYLLAAIHVLLFPLASGVSSALLKTMLWPTTQGEPLSVPDARQIKAQHVILVNPPTAEMVFYYPVVRDYLGVANPPSMHALGPGIQAMSLSQLDEATLKLSVPGGIKANMARDEVSQPFNVGDVTMMGGIRVEVLEITPERVPKVVLFRFPAPVADPQWQFYAWKDTGYAPFVLPGVGKSVDLPAVDLARMVTERLKSSN